MKKFITDGTKGQVRMDSKHASLGIPLNNLGKFILAYGIIGCIANGVSAMTTPTPPDIHALSSHTQVVQPDDVNAVVQNSEVQIVSYHQDDNGVISHIHVGSGTVISNSGTQASQGRNSILTTSTNLQNSKGDHNVVYVGGKPLNAEVIVLTDGEQNQGFKNVFSNLATVAVKPLDNTSKQIYEKLQGAELSSTLVSKDIVMDMTKIDAGSVLPGSPVFVHENGTYKVASVFVTNNPEQSMYGVHYNSGDIKNNINHWLTGHNSEQEGSGKIGIGHGAPLNVTTFTQYGRLNDPKQDMHNSVLNGLGSASLGLDAEDDIPSKTATVVGLNGQVSNISVAIRHGDLSDYTPTHQAPQSTLKIQTPGF